ncbi:MAG: hypothetical protein HYT87_13865 [Nitrospirae bacterium]|nr:hypothetical protein [Nitrospirota bacterium]
MKVKAHPLPEKRAMIGGVAASKSGHVWVSLSNTPRHLWRFDPNSGSFEHDAAGGLLKGAIYIHRSIVETPDGETYVAATRMMGGGLYMARAHRGPFSTRSFLTLFASARWFGRRFMSACLIKRDAAGQWELVGKYPFLQIDLSWDAPRKRFVRLSPDGILFIDDQGRSAGSIPSLKGFVHQACAGPQGDVLLSDTRGDAFLMDSSGRSERLGSLEDGFVGESAAPGIDGLVFAPPHYLVGGTRNRARLFVVDLERRTLRLLPSGHASTRASGLCVGAKGEVYAATGVGKVDLVRIDPASAKVDVLGRISANGVDCHHLHDLACAGGKIIGGEFYPFDVARPPWPKRDCLLWEMEV